MTGGQGVVGSNPAIPTNVYAEKGPSVDSGLSLVGTQQAHLA